MEEVNLPAELAAANPPDEYGQRLSRSSCFCDCCCGLEPGRTPTARNDCSCKRRYEGGEYDGFDTVTRLASLAELLQRPDLATALREAADAVHAHATAVLK